MYSAFVSQPLPMLKVAQWLSAPVVRGWKQSHAHQLFQDVQAPGMLASNQKTVAIAAAARAQPWVVTEGGRIRQQVDRVRAARVKRSRVQITVPARFFIAKSLLKSYSRHFWLLNWWLSCVRCLLLYQLLLYMWQLYLWLGNKKNPRSG